MWRRNRQSGSFKRHSETESKCKKGGKQKPSACTIKDKFERIFGFKLGDLSYFERFTALLYRPTDPASLGVVRALFGLCMVLDVVEERGLADIDKKWGDPMDCHFPLIHGMKAPSLPFMTLIYTIMWIGAFGIMLGFRFKVACAFFVIPYWYIFLLDKNYWNNHTYLYGIVATLFWGTEANKYFALDAIKKDNATTEKTVPLWNYFILRFQFFALYFLAGLKKSDAEWLSGYAMMNLSQHWVFNPFKLFLTTEQTDFFIVHWFGFIFDLTVGFWMLLDKTRIPAMIFCTTFHLMNFQLFSIGMFPIVCLATMPLFCNPNWPRKLGTFIKRIYARLLYKKNQGIRRCKKIFLRQNKESNDEKNDETVHGSSIDDGNQEGTNPISPTVTPKHIKGICSKSTKVTKKQKFVVSLLLFHVFLQFFLPYSHFITKGYNNWVQGMYGYSWDMMMHVWDTTLVVVKVHDNINNRDRYMNPKAWVQSDRWEKHGEMIIQYASCLKDNLIKQENQYFESGFQYDRKMEGPRLSSNISIYIDVWSSLNGRFQQRMFDPNVDMLTVDWNPFQPVSFLMPLLSEYDSYRYKLKEIEQQVHASSNNTDVLFVADFPGMYLENYISDKFSNVTLTVLEGKVAYSDEEDRYAVVSKGSSTQVHMGQFHKVTILSDYPACYMYISTKRIKEEPKMDGEMELEELREASPMAKAIRSKVNAWIRAFFHISDAYFNIVYDHPMAQLA